MALLQCRDCGADIDSDSRQTRCKECGALFPFACLACGRSLRPPFPVYGDERYLTEGGEPLCSDHFQRQCPDCSQWFQADENPGFFLCLNCSEERQRNPLPVPDWNEPVTDKALQKRAAREGQADRIPTTSWILMGISLAVLVWQLIRMVSGE